MKHRYMYEEPSFIKERPLKVLEICEFLFPLMNKIHGTNFSFRFWTTLLKYHVTTMVNREVFLTNNILENKPYLLPINAWEIPSAKKVRQKSIYYLGKALNNNTRINKINYIINKNDDVCLGTRGKEFEKFGLGVYCPSYYPLFLISKRSTRKIANSIARQQQTSFMENIIRQIPKYYVEYFSYLINKIELIEPNKKVFHAEHVSPFMEMLSAYYVENGAKYYQYQLGGFIGETQNSIDSVVYSTIDKRRTYGWRIHEKDEPHYAYRLEQFKQQYCSSKQIIDTDILICFSSVNIQTKNRYKLITEKFIQEIDINKYPHVKLRPRGVTRRKNNKKELEFLETPAFVRIDEGMKQMADVMSSSKVVLHWDHPSTNFLECVYVDHPVVAILTNDYPTDIVKPFYDFFLEQGVFHRDVESLVKHLNNIEVREWWKNVIKQPMYYKFKETFAKAPH